MLDNKTRSDLEQSEAAIVEMFPPMCWKLYRGLVKQGFGQDKAMTILLTYIQTTFGTK